MIPLCTVVVEGDPVPKGRPRFNASSGSTYTPKKTVEAEEAFAWQVKHQNPGLDPEMDGDLGVELTFCTKTKRRVDIDNLVKLVFDACNGVVWKDDNQVVYLRAAIYRADPNPRTQMMVFRART